MFRIYVNFLIILDCVGQTPLDVSEKYTCPPHLHVKVSHMDIHMTNEQLLTADQSGKNWCLYWPLWIHHNTHECVQYCSCLHLWVSVMCWSHARRVMRRIVSVSVFGQALQQRPLKGLVIRLRDQKLQQQVTDAVDQMPAQSYTNMVNIKQVKYNHLTQKMYPFLTFHLS